MTHEAALALSKDLAEDGFSHTIQVGIHDRYIPPIQCRVDIVWPLRHQHGFRHAVEILAVIADRHGLTLDTAILGQGITFSSAPDRSETGGADAS